MSSENLIITDPADLYAQGTDLPKGNQSTFKLNYAVTRHEVDEIVAQMSSMRSGLEIQVEFKYFGTVVTCIQYMNQA